MKGIKYLTIFAVAVLVLASGCMTPPDQEDAEDVEQAAAAKIGTLLPLTGDLAAYGGPMEDGARLAIKQVNENGGVLGNDVTLVTMDSGTSTTIANEAMNHLSGDHR